MKFYRNILPFLFCLMLLNIGSAQTRDPESKYHLIKKIVIGGEGSWDYPALDGTNHRLYVSHQSEVDVVDIDSGEVVGRIPTQGVHGTALLSRLGKLYVSEGNADVVGVFDIKTLSSIGKIKAGKDPDAIIYDPTTRMLFTSNGESADMTVIDARTSKVVETIPIGGDPESIAVDGKGNLWVNLADRNQVLKIDTKKLIVKNRWPIPGCEVPKGLALDVRSHRLFVGCRNRVMAVVDSDNGRVVTTLAIGDHVDTTIFDPGTDMIFNSNGDGTVTVIHEDSPDRFDVVETVPTRKGAKTMAYDPMTRRLYLPVAESDPEADRLPSPKPVSETFVVLVFGR